MLAYDVPEKNENVCGFYKKLHTDCPSFGFYKKKPSFSYKISHVTHVFTNNNCEY